MNSQQHVALIQDLLDGGMVPIHTLETSKDQGLIGRMYQLFNELDESGKPLLSNDEPHVWLTSAPLSVRIPTGSSSSTAIPSSTTIR